MLLIYWAIVLPPTQAGWKVYFFVSTYYVITRYGSPKDSTKEKQNVLGGGVSGGKQDKGVA
ncbi:hypothetical protein J2S00_003915 [Caldalkalibacillus uzonensis]|uniref:Uncharacterized protein n=1 Tax=Caldalkalibacillus uzonensis TaxID=353224 RepID=A0ABU0CY48_9BACI|nr:hypothetical protein [Caldalkalibacillus uzonensis]